MDCSILQQRESWMSMSRLIGNLALFQGLEPGLIDEIASRARLRRVQRNKVIYREKDVCIGFYVVVFGCVRTSVFSNCGIETPIHITHAGHSFGDAPVFQGVDYYTSAIAVEDSTLIFISREHVFKMLETHTTLATRLLFNLSYRVHTLIEDVGDFLLQPPASRVVSYLVRLMTHQAGETGNDIRLVLKKKLMAAQLNLQPETLSRYFRRMVDMGIITIEGGTVTVHNLEHLCTFANVEGIAKGEVPEPRLNIAAVPAIASPASACLHS